MQHITIYDYLLLPLYLFLFYILVKRKSLKFTSPELRNIFLIAFGLRMFGSVAYSLMIQYYYGYGDAFGYYMGGNFIIEQIQNDVGNLKYFFYSGAEIQRVYINEEGSAGLLNGYIATTASYTVMKASALISVLSFNKFLISSLFFALFSFAGQWKLFTVFNDINKGRNQKLMAIAILYTPAIWFWSSGLIKESLCMGGLGFIASILYNAIVKKRIGVTDWVLFFVFVYFVYIIKSYIILILAATLFLTLLFLFLQRLKLFVLKLFLLIVTVFILLLVTSLYDFSGQINELAKQSISQIEHFQLAYHNIQDEKINAAFKIELIDPTLGNLVLRTPMVILSCLFRPFLWESNKLIILMSSLESTFLLLCTLFLLIKLKVFGLFKLLVEDPYVFFCFVFSMILAAIIGFTTFNFGTMTRYKIVLLPFYYFLLVYIYSNLKKKKV